MARKRIIDRSFSTREKVLMLALVVVLLIGFYYFAVVQNVANIEIDNASKRASIEQQLAVERANAIIYQNMQQELDALESQGEPSVVAVYDNVGNELEELNEVLAGASAYDISFSQPLLSGETVRRPTKLTYTMATYDEALKVVSSLLDGPYRCEVVDFSFTGKMLADGTIENVNATLSLIFYETTKGATSLNGLSATE